MARRSTLGGSENGLIGEESGLADIASSQSRIRDHTDNESTRQGEPEQLASSMATSTSKQLTHAIPR